MWTIDEIKKFKEAGDLRNSYQNEPDKACFQHDIAYGDFKDLTRRTVSDKILRHKAYNLAKNPKYDVFHQRGLTSMVNKKIVDKKILPREHGQRP